MRIIFAAVLFSLIQVFISCSSSENNSSIDKDTLHSHLKDLVEYGYSIDELSIRTGYSNEQLVDCFHQQEELLDSAGNSTIEELWRLHTDGKVIPVNKVGITATKALWEIYTRVQNFPLVSVYSGIGIVNVTHSMTQRETLNVRDSIRALVAYINMNYDLVQIPRKLGLEENTIFGEGIDNMTIPNTFHPELTDGQRRKIEYYLWRNEQFEHRANNRLKKSIEQKLDQRTQEAVTKFVEKDLDSYLSAITMIFKDSLEKQTSLKISLAKRLELEELSQEIKDEIIAYCIAINTSRTLLVNDMLGYEGASSTLSATNRTQLLEYQTNLDEANRILYQKSLNAASGLASNGIATAVTIAIAPWELGFTAAATATGTPGAGAAAALLMFALDEKIFEMTEQAADFLDPRTEQEKDTKQMAIALKAKLKSDLDCQLEKSLNSNGNYYQCLEKNTIDYYNQVKEYFKIK